MLGCIIAIGLVCLVFGAAAGLSPVFPLPSRSARVNLFTNGASSNPLTVNATSTSGSPDLTAVGSLAGVAIGAVVVSPLTPSGKTVVAMDDAAHTLTLSGNAGITGTEDFVFANPPNGLVTNGKSFRLFKSDFTPTVNTVLADLTAIEADFSGYAAKTLTMTLGYIDGTSVPYAQSQLLSWVKSGATGNTVYGWWIDDGTNVIAVAKFDNLVALSTDGAELSGIFQDGYPTGSGWKPLIPNNA